MELLLIADDVVGGREKGRRAEGDHEVNQIRILRGRRRSFSAPPTPARMGYRGDTPPVVSGLEPPTTWDQKDAKEQFLEEESRRYGFDLNDAEFQKQVQREYPAFTGELSGLTVSIVIQLIWSDRHDLSRLQRRTTPTTFDNLRRLP